MKLTDQKGSIALLPMLFLFAFGLFQPVSAATSSDIPKRAFNPRIDGVWSGNGISYSAYRDGESPEHGSLTAKTDILDDLRLISKHWNLIRLYGAGLQSENILKVIEEYELPIRVMQGAWIGSDQTTEENNAEIDRLIGLAKRFPRIIIAVNVGNEIFVDWSAHRFREPESIIRYIRKVRSQVSQPVTVVDDYNFWNKPQAKRIAKEIDFIGLNAYAFWNNKALGEAMRWTDATYRDIRRRFPEHLVVYSETGWPTSRVYDDGSYEGTLIGKAGESEQCNFYREFREWSERNRVISFYFEAFDENWKGGDDGPKAGAKAEKHWGIYRSDRTPKQVMIDDSSCDRR